eukprot:4073372-Amphidinium_carterae.1
MWTFLRARKGKEKFTWRNNSLFHNIDKTPEEQERSKRVSRAIKSVRKYLMEEGATPESVIGDYAAGIV